MFSLTIVFGPSSAMWALMFKTEEAARAKLVIPFGQDECPGMIKLVDDFGQECTLRTAEIHGWMLEDLEQSKLTHIERALHQARTKLKGDEIARADPTLRAATQQQPILQPAMPGMMPNGGFRG